MRDGTHGTLGPTRIGELRLCGICACTPFDGAVLAVKAAGHSETLRRFSGRQRLTAFSGQLAQYSLVRLQCLRAEQDEANEPYCRKLRGRVQNGRQGYWCCLL